MKIYKYLSLFLILFFTNQVFAAEECGPRNCMAACGTCDSETYRTPYSSTDCDLKERCEEGDCNSWYECGCHWTYYSPTEREWVCGICCGGHDMDCEEYWDCKTMLLCEEYTGCCNVGCEDPGTGGGGGDDDPVFIPATPCTFQVRVWEEPEISETCSPGSTNYMNGVSVSIYDESNTLRDSGETNASGVFSTDIIPEAVTATLSVCLTEPEYEIVCDNGSRVVGSCVQVPFSIDASTCTTTTAPIGMQKYPSDPWISSLGGDVFAEGITNNPSEYATVFQPYLASSYDSILNFVSANSFITTADTNTSEQGGYIESLTDNEPGFSHNDVALEKFRFMPPTYFEPESYPSGDNFEANHIYTISVGDFNDKLSSALDYSIAGEGSVVLYVTGTDTLNINNTITTSSNDRLLVIVEGSLQISKDIIHTVETYEPTATPDLMAGFIIQGDINFESEGTDPGSDLPLLVQGPFVSKGAINFERNLGSNNRGYPATAVQYHANFLYDLTSLERSDAESASITGVRTFDVQFVYQD